VDKKLEAIVAKKERLEYRIKPFRTQIFRYMSEARFVMLPYSLWMDKTKGDTSLESPAKRGSTPLDTPKR
jgi:hypothetical protein